MPEDRTAPEGERRVYYFAAYVRVEATSQEEAWERISTEPVYVSEADASDPGHENDVNLVVTDLLDHEPLDTGPLCICPPDLIARGGFRGGCRAHHG
jgi:hypothetical protein